MARADKNRIYVIYSSPRSIRLCIRGRAADGKHVFPTSRQQALRLPRRPASRPSLGAARPCCRPDLELVESVYVVFGIGRGVASAFMVSAGAV